jgi:hypothetical protein
MKLLVILLLAFVTVNCSKVKFSSDQVDEIIDIINDDGDQNTDDDDTVVDDDQDDHDHDDEVCPRYDIVIISKHQNINKLNYKFTFNAEMDQKSTEGDIKVKFNKDDGAVHLTQCSGSFVNTMYRKNMKPLNVIENLTGEIVINHGMSCPTVMPVRSTIFKVIDAATGEALYDEQKLINEIGSCEFGYTEAGNDMRNKVLNLADDVVSDMASACNK